MSFTTPTWIVRGQPIDFSQTPFLMGIVNTTPDSFSDGGKFLAIENAVQQVSQLDTDGAAIIDIGGESTRPGAEPVPENEEIDRVIPLIEHVSGVTNRLISIDTTKSKVARLALQAGAQIINDISGCTFDPNMPEVCAEFSAGVICMHIQGTPQTMQQSPTYVDVVEEICDFFEHRMTALEQAGVRREQIVLDPGIGFGKTADHNLQILRSIPRLRALGRPICIGHSRKRFLQKLLGRPVDERVFGTVGISVGLALQGTEIIRVHDVAASRDAIIACRAVTSSIQ